MGKGQTDHDNKRGRSQTYDCGAEQTAAGDGGGGGRALLCHTEIIVGGPGLAEQGREMVLYLNTLYIIHNTHYTV